MKAGGVFALVMLAAAVAQAAELKGEVKVAGRNGSVPTYVYAEPVGGGAAAKPGRFTVKQVNKDFRPPVLVVPVGSTVDFSNEDTVMHNIFSKTKPGEFDLGLYKTSKPVVFKNANTYRVFCNIHPQMTAVILVVPTSHIAEVGADGHYKLEVPAGKYKVTAWSERAAAPVTAEATAGGSAPSLTLDESKYVGLSHKNKFGKDYQPYEKH
jgi:plastocyanin